MQKQFVVKGINSDTDTCQVCGKTGLKRVVWLAEVSPDGEQGEAVAMGTCCAAKKIGSSRKFSNVYQISEALSSRIKMDKAINEAEIFAKKYGEPFVVFRCARGKTYSCARETVYNNNPRLYGAWVVVITPDE